jgi:hypothetical protein
MARLKHHGTPAMCSAWRGCSGRDWSWPATWKRPKGPDHPKPYRLHVRIYGADGALLGQLSFDLDRPLLQPQSFADKVSAIQLLIEQSLLRTAAPQGSPSPVLLPQPVAAIPPPPVATTLPQRAGQVQQYEDNEKVRFDPEKEKAQLVPLSESAQELLLRRPPWQAAIDLQLGYVYSTRLLKMKARSCALGARERTGWRSLASCIRWRCCRAVVRLLAGLGLRAQLVLPFWGEIAHVLAAWTAAERNLHRHRVSLRSGTALAPESVEPSCCGQIWRSERCTASTCFRPLPKRTSTTCGCRRVTIAMSAGRWRCGCSLPSGGA